MRRTVATFAAAGISFAISVVGVADERVVGSSNNTDHEAANEALDRAEQNAPDEADHGLSTAREAVNNNGVGEGSRTTGARNSSSRSTGGHSRSGGRGNSGGASGR